jgi:hypothetical protein
MNIVSKIAKVFPVILLASTALHAQPTGSSSPAAATVLREGTPVVIAFAGNLSSKTAAKGDVVKLELAGDLTADGVLVARAGAVVDAHVAAVTKAAAPGKSGAIELQIYQLDTGNAVVPLRGSKTNGQSEGILYSLPFHLKWPGGLFRTGDNVEIKAGTTLTVFVASDVALPAIQ